MKTAMQELIDLIKTLNKELFATMHNKGIIKNALEKEKENIINTYWAAYKEGMYSSDKTAQEYYIETFLNK